MNNVKKCFPKQRPKKSKIISVDVTFENRLEVEALSKSTVSNKLEMQE